ncbi:MAG: hypothetical protein IJQ66_01950 [Clostridia bacterium]|nr:hypothetical protein [Clostridia bacterium]
MEESKNLKLARQARAEGNSEDAKMFYNKVREEDPENGEAKFFYAFYSIYEGKNVEIPNRFLNLCKTLPSSINFIKESSLSKEDQLKSIEEIVNAFVPETWAENRYMNNKNHETKIGDHYVTVFDYSAIKSVCITGMKALKALGDQIEKLYIADPKCKQIAAIAWKEYVSLSQKWYRYAEKGDAEIYAEKIKKVDPSYTMPKKAGCISLANKKQ